MPHIPPTRHTSRPTIRLVLVGLLSLVAAALPVALASQASATPVTVKASADSYVLSDTPDVNYGAKYVLAASALSATTPTTTSYMKFDVSGLSATPARVTLRLYSYAKSATGLQVLTAANSWTESGITFANAPGVDMPVGTMPDIAVNAWSELDVSPAVTGNGTYTLAVTTSATANKKLSSRESTATPPQLVIEPGTTPTPTPTPTPTASSTPTATATPTATSTPDPVVTTTFTPAADATVRSDQPDTSSGTAYTLFAQALSSNGPEQRTYLKVAVSGLTGSVSSASLQLYSYSTSSDGIDVSLAPGDWTETDVTWNNAPPPTVHVGSARPLVLNSWANADVTAAVTGNGTYTFVLTTARTSANKVGSREATGNPPRLVVTTGAATTPTPTPTPTPSSSASPAATPSVTPSVTPSSSPSGTPTGGDPTIVAAGDIACPQTKTPTATSCQQLATSDLAMSLHPDALLPLGDNAYELGSLADFQAMYAPSWGRLDPIAHPVPGNHEYGYIGSAVEPTGGAGYFQYFGPVSHPEDPSCTISCTSWYSFDVGAWHLIALDSQCGVIGGCNPGNPQYRWLLNDLNTHSNTCTLAYWHIPLFSSSQDHQPDMISLYKLLYDKGTDVVLSGHAHFYERFGPQDSTGAADPARGIRELLVGTGGRSFFAVRATPSANSETRIANTFGVLQMTLHPTSYDWAFVPVPGSTATDSGSASCH